MTNCRALHFSEAVHPQYPTTIMTQFVQTRSPNTKTFQTRRLRLQLALLWTKIYNRLTYRRSGLSLPSSAGRSRGWSFLSDISLSEVTNVSIISLPLSLPELYRGCQNNFRSDTPDVKPQPSSTAVGTQEVWSPLMFSGQDLLSSLTRFYRPPKSPLSVGGTS